MADLLRSAWDEPRPPHPPPVGWRDRALVGALVPAAIVEAVLRTEVPWRFVTAAVLIALLPTLLWRRDRPLLMVAVGFTVTGLLPLLTGPAESYTMAYLLILPYALFRWGSGRQAVLGSAIVLGKVCLWLFLGYLSLGSTVGGFVVLFAVTAAGAALRYRAGARERTLEQVKLLERERLARDLHDTVAHHVSAMAIRAQAGLATLGSNPNAATEALGVIEAEASLALAEMRSMVRVLRRDQPADLAPAPGIRDLKPFAGTTRGGPRVDVEISGDVDGVALPVGAAVYRLAQESVTNARRHARHATRIEVRVEADTSTVRLTVMDDGDPGAVRLAGSQGYGLIGMIERADLLGGTCTAGPVPGQRGWTVTAVLPRTGSAA